MASDEGGEAVGDLAGDPEGERDFEPALVGDDLGEVGAVELRRDEVERRLLDAGREDGEQIRVRDAGADPGFAALHFDGGGVAPPFIAEELHHVGGGLAACGLSAGRAW